MCIFDTKSYYNEYQNIEKTELMILPQLKSRAFCSVSQDECTENLRKDPLCTQASAIGESP